MIIGKLRHRVALQRRTTAPDATGGRTPNWSTLATVWGSVNPVRGQERYANNRESSEVTHRVRIRAYDGLTTTDRILFDSRVFDIQYIENFEERGIYMDVYAIEQVQ